MLLLYHTISQLLQRAVMLSVVEALGAGLCALPFDGAQGATLFWNAILFIVGEPSCGMPKQVLHDFGLKIVFFHIPSNGRSAASSCVNAGRGLYNWHHEETPPYPPKGGNRACPPRFSLLIPPIRPLLSST